MLLQLATLKLVAWQVEHAVIIRATTRSTCNATMLRDKLNENITSLINITWLLRKAFKVCCGLALFHGLVLRIELT